MLVLHFVQQEEPLYHLSFISLIILKISATIKGAKPIEGSSNNNNFGFDNSALAIAKHLLLTTR